MAFNEFWIASIVFAKDVHIGENRFVEFGFHSANTSLPVSILHFRSTKRRDTLSKRIVTNTVAQKCLLLCGKNCTTYKTETVERIIGILSGHLRLYCLLGDESWQCGDVLRIHGGGDCGLQCGDRRGVLCPSDCNSAAQEQPHSSLSVYVTHGEWGRL